MPDSPDPVRQRLTDLRDGLLRLHKTLLDSETAIYDREIQRITSSGQLLDLVLNDPQFAWLRELSQMVVVIDEMLDDEEPVTDEIADQLVLRARVLLTPAEAKNSFREHYLEALQRDPDAVMAHAEMGRLLVRLDKK
jgi:hypothetical protein